MSGLRRRASLALGLLQLLLIVGVEVVELLLQLGKLLAQQARELGAGRRQLRGQAVRSDL